jgi:anti-sigma factor RsiW
MSAHLSSTVLNGLADGELSAEQLAIAQEHLAACPSCTSNALAQALLKAAVAKSGHRYATPPQLAERLKRFASQEFQQNAAPRFRAGREPATRLRRSLVFAGWAVAAMLLLAGLLFVPRAIQHSGAASAERTALVTEVCDLHVATLAAGLPTQVISTDRHTVKPWFQGKIPFSFNLPEQLPSDVKLEGANLSYLRSQPVAQLVYSIGRHRASVFVRQRTGSAGPNAFQAEHSGFHVSAFRTADLDVVAVSDADPARLSDLVRVIEDSQTKASM